MSSHIDMSYKLNWYPWLSFILAQRKLKKNDEGTSNSKTTSSVARSYVILLAGCETWTQWNVWRSFLGIQCFHCSYIVAFVDLYVSWLNFIVRVKSSLKYMRMFNNISLDLDIQQKEFFFLFWRCFNVNKHIVTSKHSKESMKRRHLLPISSYTLIKCAYCTHHHFSCRVDDDYS
jgi:hypothetical protein